VPQAFKHFLDTVAQEAPTESRAETAQGDVRERRIQLLTILHRDGPTTVDQLRSASGMEFTEFAGTLKSFLDAGLVTMTGQPGKEIAELTEAGKALGALEL
jgi:predicted transcriptional regulator